MEKINPFEGRDLHVALRFPTISWSSVNAFVNYGKESWYENYVLGIKTEPNAAMQGGVDVGERIVKDPTFIPEIPRPEIFEDELFGTLVFKGKKKYTINLTGHLDGHSPSFPGIDEYKTTTNKNKWSQKAVDNWGQITFYCLLVWLNYKIPPEKQRLRLYSIPMKVLPDFKVVYTGEPPTEIHTKRTMKDILLFSAFLDKTFTEMNKYVETRKSLQ